MLPRGRTHARAPPTAVSISAVIFMSVLFVVGSLAMRGVRRWMRWRTDALKPNDTAQQTAAGDCPRCGYDLTGLKSLQCPECGFVVPKRVAGDRDAQERRLAAARQKVAEAYARRKDAK
jgi:hypothetical protein